LLVFLCTPHSIKQGSYPSEGWPGRNGINEDEPLTFAGLKTCVNIHMSKHGINIHRTHWSRRVAYSSREGNEI
jgi:hypothetical protein